MAVRIQPERSALAGARHLALAYLDEAEAGRQRLRGAADDEALHDFRVGLRRLRSTVRAYRAQLGGSIGRRDRRRLRRLARATGESRDREVQLLRLAGLQPHGTAEAAAIAWLADRLARAKAESDTRVRRVVDDLFPKERDRLARRLRRWRIRLEDADAPGATATIGVVAAGLARELAAALRADLDRVRSIADQAAAHEARIAAKKLRYLLEPFREDVPAARDVVAAIKGLQDVLGDMHDVELLHAEILRLARDAEAEADRIGTGDHGDGDAEPTPSAEGLAALAAGLEAERGRLFRRLRRRWLGAAPAAFFDAVSRAAAQLGGAAGGLEVERKFLLRERPRLPRGARRTRIEQGWIPGERIQERIRRSRDSDGTRYTRTLKQGRGIARTELEEDTTRDVFDRLWPLTRGRRVVKRRHSIEHDGLTWEIDEFLDRVLWLAGVELNSATATVSLPPWLEAVLDREVTGEDAWANVNLAR
jgi:CHAD domain-containing protein/CYTH domain-containing protein